MARTKRLLRKFRPATSDYEYTETTTLVQRFTDGTVIRHDPPNFWIVPGASYYGPAPAGWDPAKAVPEDFVQVFECTEDNS